MRNPVRRIRRWKNDLLRPSLKDTLRFVGCFIHGHFYDGQFCSRCGHFYP